MLVPLMTTPSSSRESLRDRPACERPRERLLLAGPAALSDRELVALLLGTGPPGEGVLAFSDRLLEDIGGIPGLGWSDAARLLGVKGMGPGRAAMLAAGVELGRRTLLADRGGGAPIRGPGDLARPLVAALGGENREVLGLFLLDARMRLLGFRRISRGTLTSTQASVREVFAPVLSTTAAAVVLAHNHPSGDPTPSAEDVEVTRRMVVAGQTLEIPVLDHIILGGQRLHSLRDSGQMPGGGEGWVP